MIHLSFADIKKGAATLAQKMKKEGYMPDYTIGITVGGLIPLALVAKELETQNVATISASAYDEGERHELKIRALPDIDLKGMSILLVDDISDTGATLQELSKLLCEKYGAREVKTAAIVIRKDKPEYRPDFHAREHEEWTEFPWEKGVEKMRDV